MTYIYNRGYGSRENYYHKINNENELQLDVVQLSLTVFNESIRSRNTTRIINESDSLQTQLVFDRRYYVIASQTIFESDEILHEHKLQRTSTHHRNFKGNFIDFSVRLFSIFSSSSFFPSTHCPATWTILWVSLAILYSISNWLLFLSVLGYIQQEKKISLFELYCKLHTEFLTVD